MNHLFQVGETVTIVKEGEAIFHIGDKVTITSIEEYPLGSGQAINPGYLAVHREPNKSNYWVSMSGVEVAAVPEEEMEEVIQSIMRKS